MNGSSCRFKTLKELRWVVHRFMPFVFSADSMTTCFINHQTVLLGLESHYASDIQECHGRQVEKRVILYKPESGCLFSQNESLDPREKLDQHLGAQAPKAEECRAD